MPRIKAKANTLFEVSFEICNKVGGIHTVISSKVTEMQKYYKNYFLIGPYYKDKADLEFEEKEIPKKFQKIFDELKQDGIKCYYGKWLNKGEPAVILIDFSDFNHALDHLKIKYWEKYGVESISAGWDFFEPMLWSTAAGKLIEKYQKSNKDEKIIAHFHEWISGFGILLLDIANTNVKTIFTTHATMLGRAISGSGEDLYKILDSMNPEKEAKKHNVMDKFSAECACAKTCHVFTTVSEITGIEAEKILGRKPDVLVLNGLTVDEFPSLEETSNLHIETRDKIREFLSYYFFPYYTFDLKHTIIFFISGRYEFHNKGIDLFIKSLAKLNDYLKSQNKSKRNIAAFFFVPGASKNIRQEILENKTFYRHIKSYIDDNIQKIKENIISSIIQGKNIEKEPFFEQEFLNDMKKNLKIFKKQGLPPIATHYIENEHCDPIINTLKENGLDNKEDDKVKVIHYPIYLDGADGLIDLSYYDTISGCHLGVFPSFYEPWGYTPVESAIMGVPSVTSDQAGFGKYIQPHLSKEKDKGIYVIDRYQKDDTESLEQLFDILKHYAILDHKGRVKNKIKAKELVNKCDWEDFIEFYIQAHNLALER